MNRHLLLLAGVLGGGMGSIAAAAPPPISFTAEPRVNGKLVYLLIAPETDNDPLTYLFGLQVAIVNTGTNDLTLTQIRVEFSDATGVVLSGAYERDRTIPAGAADPVLNYLSEDPLEAFRLADPPPTEARIELSFDGFTEPAAMEYDLAPYLAPTPTGSYRFPGNAADLNADQVWRHKDPHEGGNQFFAYDLKVAGWDTDANAFVEVKQGTDGVLNEDYHGWGMPIHAMADGIVLSCRTDVSNNPTAGTHAIQRMQEYTVGPACEATVSRLDTGPIPTDGRIATMERGATGSTQIRVWDISEEGTVITLLGSAAEPTALAIRAVALQFNELVTAVRDASGVLELGLWDISSDALTITPAVQVTNEWVGEIAVTRISNSRIATAVTTGSGVLRVSVTTGSGVLRVSWWNVDPKVPSISLVDEDMTTGTATDPSLAVLSTSRIAASYQDAGGLLKVIVWDLNSPAMGAPSLDRKGSNTADPITQAALLATSSTNLYSAMRTSTGSLKMLRWIEATGRTRGRRRRRGGHRRVRRGKGLPGGRGQNNEGTTRTHDLAAGTVQGK